MFKDSLFIRNLEAENLLENFLVAGIVSLLVIRFYLKLTHYPIIGHGMFHIAHMLWGGLFMMIGIVILLSFLNKSMTRVAAIISGIGFGAFIDELGKFITSDNNYFFQPTIALIYVVFILLYLSTKALPKLRKITKTEYLINAMEMTKEAIINDLDHEEKQQALSYLEKSHQHSPITKALSQLLKELDSITPPQPSFFSQMRTGINMLYHQLLKSNWFIFLIVASIIVQAIISLFLTFFLVAALNKYVFAITAFVFLAFSFSSTKEYRMAIRILLYLSLIILLGTILGISVNDTALPVLSFDEWGRVFFSSVSALIAIKGMYELRYSRLTAYNSFKLSILISIFLTQFFVFYKLQFLALFGFAVNIIMHLTIQYMIQKEAHRRVSSH